MKQFMEMIQTKICVIIIKILFNRMNYVEMEILTDRVISKL